MDIGLWIYSARRVPNVSEASLKSLLSNIMDWLCYTTTPSGGSRPRPRSGPDSRLVGNPSLRPLTSVLNVNAERHRDEDHLQHRAGNRRVMFENPNIIVSVHAPSRISYCKC